MVLIRTLSNVPHVPDLKGNFISLCTLEYTQCKYLAQGEVLNVSKGTQTLSKRLRHESLYVLQGSTVTGSLIASTSAPYDIFTY